MNAAEGTSDEIWRLIAQLRNGSAQGKCDAARGLGDLGAQAQSSVQALTQALNDKDTIEDTHWYEWGDCSTSYHYVREEAARALLKIDGKASDEMVVPVMVALLSQVSCEDTTSCKYVRFSPSEWRSVAGPALPALLALWLGDNTVLREAAFEALCGIVSPEPGDAPPSESSAEIKVRVEEFRQEWALRRRDAEESARQAAAEARRWEENHRRLNEWIELSMLEEQKRKLERGQQGAEQ